MTEAKEKELLQRLAVIQNEINLIMKELQGNASVAGLGVEAWLWEWFNTYKKPFLKPRSLLSLSHCIEKYLIPALGQFDIEELDTAAIQRVINEIAYPRQREISYTIIRAALLKAYRTDKMSKNIVEGLERPRSETKKGKAFTVAEQLKFENEIKGTKHELLFIGYLYTGCRLREMLSVGWHYINFAANEIQINGTKTETSNRTVPLFYPFRRLLLLCERSGELVFNFKPDYVDRQFQKICNRIGLHGFTVHSLRHTFATRCLERGVKPSVLQSWLGHKDITMTLGTYAHVQPDLSKEEAQKMGDFDLKAFCA